MFLKLVVFGIFVATSVQSRNPPVHLDPKFVDGAFNGYIGLIRNGVDSASRIVSDSRANIHQHKDSITRQLRATLKAGSANLLEELYEMIEKARISRVDINVCVANSEQRIKDLPSRFDREIIKCQEDIVNEHIAHLDEGNLEVEHSNQELDTLVKRYDGCGRNIGLRCRIDIKVLARKASVRIPVALSKVVGRISDSDSRLPRSVEDCGFRKVLLAESEGQRLINDVAACIDSTVKPIHIN